MSSDHYHYVSEVQGAADQSHSHTPREIGAAEDHDFTMLQREVNSLEADKRELERKVQVLRQQLAGVREDLDQTSLTLMEHMKNSVILAERVEQIARHLVAQQGGF